MFDKYQKALDEMMKLDQLEADTVITELLEVQKIDFVNLSIRYVKYLEQKNTELSHQIMPLAMHLSMACGGLLDKQKAKELIYKSKYFEGAPYHEELKKEFEK